MYVRMVDENKNPRPGAHIIFEGRISGKRYEDTTNKKGAFPVLLPVVESYRVFYQHDGKTKEYDLLELSERRFQTYELLLIYEPAHKIIIENVLFETGEEVISDVSKPELDKLVELMEEDITLEVEVSGHTDSVGSDAYNLRLSQKRADAVKKYLVDKGVKPERIRAVGYGESQPVATNETEEGRTRNRRTEVKAIN